MKNDGNIDFSYSSAENIDINSVLIFLGINVYFLYYNVYNAPYSAKDNN